MKAGLLQANLTGMRISTSYLFDSYTRDIQTTQSKYLLAQERVSSGKQLTKMSDDPAAMRSVLNMRSLQSQLGQYSQNLTRAKSVLGLSENALSDANNVVNRAYSLAVQSSNTTTTQSQRTAMASEIGDLQTKLLQIANSKSANGDYIFAGQKTDTTPFTVGTSGLSFNGDTNPINVEGSATDTLQINTPGSPLFTDAYNRLANLKTALESGSTSQIADVSIGELQNSQQQISLARGTIGSRTNQLTSLQQTHDRRISDLKVSTSDLEDVDTAQAIVDLNSAQTAYQASLQVASQGFKLSLMDFIR